MAVCVGICFAHGEGAEKDSAKAIEYVQLAANQNDPHAQHELGCIYMRGDGTAVVQTRIGRHEQKYQISISCPHRLPKE